jgi:hypothetical protein
VAKDTERWCFAIRWNDAVTDRNNLTKTVNDEVLEFLRAFIAGGVNQDFKPWASELYQKLYRRADEPWESPLHKLARAVIEEHDKSVGPEGPSYELYGQAQKALQTAALDDMVRISEEAGLYEAPEAYQLDFALRIARLWRAGKMIGGDEDAVRNALLAEVERLHALNCPAEPPPPQLSRCTCNALLGPRDCPVHNTQDQLSENRPAEPT